MKYSSHFLINGLWVEKFAMEKFKKGIHWLVVHVYSEEPIYQEKIQNLINDTFVGRLGKEIMEFPIKECILILDVGKPTIRWIFEEYIDLMAERYAQVVENRNDIVDTYVLCRFDTRTVDYHLTCKENRIKLNF